MLKMELVEKIENLLTAEKADSFGIADSWKTPKFLVKPKECRAEIMCSGCGETLSHAKEN